MKYEHYYTLQKPVLEKYISHTFVETGTYLGDSVLLALECGFEKIISIELNPELYEGCVTMFKDDVEEGTVELILGDSLNEVKRIAPTLTERATFWLDAHWDFGPKGEKLCPLYEELESIAESPIKNHTIMIDDMRCLGLTHWGNGVTKEGLIERIKKINPEYQITFEPSPCGPQDIMVAYIPSPKMKMGILLRGISQGHGKADFSRCVENLQENLIKPLSENNEVNLYLCTYVHPQINELSEAYNPKKLELIPFSGSNQVTTFSHSLKMLRGEDLDFVFVVRFDLWLHNKITECNIDFEKFNFVFKLSPQEAPYEKYEFVSDLGFFFNYRHLESIISATDFLSENPPRKITDLHGIYKTLKLFLPEEQIHFMTPVVWRQQGDEYPLYTLIR
jgi:hypothetical protein